MMALSTDLRPQASEFQPQKGESSASSSNTITAVPTPTQTPAPNMETGGETAEQIKERVAEDNRGSLSTVTETMTPDHDEIILDMPFSPKGNVEKIDSSASNGELINEVTNMVSECVVAPTSNKSTLNVNSSIMSPTYGGASATYGRYTPGQGYNPVGASNNYPVQPYRTTSGAHANSGTASNLAGQPGQTILSSGSDPISEGRRIYIGNLKFSVDRNGIKRLLRHYNVNNTVEKIYMPYSDTPLDSSASGVDSRGEHHHNSNSAYHHNACDSQRGDGELSNKGFVFVTYSNAYEAEEAIRCLSGVMHHDRRLVCRPGLPKGVAFRQPDTGNYRGGKRRRGRMSHGGRFEDDYTGQFQARSAPDGYASYNAGEHAYGGYGYSYGYGNGAGINGYVGGGYAPRAPMDSGYFYGSGYGASGQRHSMDSGYRSGAPSTWKGSDGYVYGNGAGGYHQ